MALTVEAVERELAAAEAEGGPLDLEAVATAMSHGSLMGARGNSGVILSPVLRGMAGAFRDAGGRDGPGAVVGPADLVEALTRASDSAYAAVSNPVEGTILTVARAAAKGAARAVDGAGAGLADVLDAARDDASKALAGTTAQLPALRTAGVVDAGGAGLVLLFDSFLQVVEGRPIEAPPMPAGFAASATNSASALGPDSGAVGRRAGGDGQGQAQGEGGGPEDGADLRYEVMFFLEASDESVPAFRSVWANYGGSIVIVGGHGLYKCHIHTDEIGPAIEAAIEIGRPRDIQVTDLAEQVEEERWVREAAAAGAQEEPPAEPVKSAVVAVASGDGVRRIFRSLGARQVVTGGQSANPSTEQILLAIAEAPSEQVVVLPNNRNVVAAAEQAAVHSPKKVRVVPTPGIPEGFAALLAYDPEADLDTNADNMTAAAQRVVAGEVTRASRHAATSAGEVKEGDWLGISRERIEVVVRAPSTAADAAIALLDVLVSDGPDHEIVTIIEGDGAHHAETRRIVEWLAEQRPGTTSEVHHGGQPIYPYLFSIE
jgi:DAK2 domain fusion protein YloV